MQQPSPPLCELLYIFQCLHSCSLLLTPPFSLLLHTCQTCLVTFPLNTVPLWTLLGKLPLFLSLSVYAFVELGHLSSTVGLFYLQPPLRTSLISNLAADPNSEI